MSRPASTSPSSRLTFPADEFASRRRKLAGKIGEGAVALLQGAPTPAGFRPFRQSNELHYLCGLEVPHSYLLIHGGSGESALFLPRREPPAPQTEVVPGAEDVDAVRASTGVETILGVEHLAQHLARTASGTSDVDIVYTPASPAEGRAESRDQLLRSAAASAADPWDGAPTREGRLVHLLRARFPQFEVRDLSPIADALRLVKSQREIEIMRHAGRLAALGVAEAMRSTAPGVLEYELAAVASFVFAAGGARDGYEAIIAGGANAWFPHYWSKDAPLRDGDWVLMDYAPEVAYYTSDIGRMWPANGQYLPWQRQLYGFVVDYHKELLSHIKPGVTADQVLGEAAEAMHPRLDRAEFAGANHRRAAEALLEFPGSLSHPVGMAVHDVGDYRDDRLEIGIVLSVDPQLWVPEERLYVRVEDTIVITRDGIENLTAAAPLDLDDVERVMQEPGLLQTYRRRHPADDRTGKHGDGET